jgi:signal transduction histidine kinase
VDVRIWKHPSAAILEVTDNGVGMNMKQLTDKRSLGLLGMRERAVLFGGELEITSKKKAGTKVTLLIPLGKKRG